MEQLGATAGYLRKRAYVDGLSWCFAEESGTIKAKAFDLWITVDTKSTTGRGSDRILDAGGLVMLEGWRSKRERLKSRGSRKARKIWGWEAAGTYRHAQSG